MDPIAQFIPSSVKKSYYSIERHVFLVLFFNILINIFRILNITTPKSYFVIYCQLFFSIYLNFSYFVLFLLILLLLCFLFLLVFSTFVTLVIHDFFLIIIYFSSIIFPILIYDDMLHCIVENI